MSSKQTPSIVTTLMMRFSNPPKAGAQSLNKDSGLDPCHTCTGTCASVLISLTVSMCSLSSVCSQQSVSLNFSFFFEMEFRSCYPGCSAMA